MAAQQQLAPPQVPQPALHHASRQAPSPLQRPAPPQARRNAAANGHHLVHRLHNPDGGFGPLGGGPPRQSLFQVQGPKMVLVNGGAGYARHLP